MGTGKFEEFILKVWKKYKNIKNLLEKNTRKTSLEEFH